MDVDKIKKGGLFFFIKIAYRNIFRNIRRSILCMIAVSMSVFIMILLSGFMEGMIDAINIDIVSFESAHINMSSKKFEKYKLFLPTQYPLEIDDQPLDKIINEIESIKGVKKAFPRIQTIASVSNSIVKNAVIWGFNMEDELKYNYFNQRTKNKNNCLKEGRLPDKGKNECIIGYELAKKMKVGIGDKITLKVISSEYSDKFLIPKIVGIFDFDYSEYDKNYIIISFEKLQKLLTLHNKTEQIFIYLDNINKTNVITDILKEKYETYKVQINRWQDNYWIILMEQMNIMMIIIYIVFIIVASFLIINTIIMIITERMKEIGMMGALGMNRLEIVGVFFWEAVILSLYGSFIGAFLGGISTLILHIFPIDVSSLTGGSMPINNTLFIKFSFNIIINGFLYGLIISSLCTIFPSLKAAFIEPVEALRR